MMTCFTHVQASARFIEENQQELHSNDKLMTISCLFQLVKTQKVCMSLFNLEA